MKKIARLMAALLVTSIVFTGCGKDAKGSLDATQVSKDEIMCVEKETTNLITEETLKQEGTELETQTETQTEIQTENQTEEQTEDVKEEETSKQTQNSNKVTNKDKNNVSEKDDSVTVGEKNSDKLTYDTNNKVNSDTECMKLAKEVIKKIITNGMSDFEKAKAIHDYMLVNIDYDYDDYLKNTIPYESYNVIGALKNKYAVCAGYAKTFKLLCELADLECTYVVGTARGYHAWNQVKIDGKWYNVDVTWDDPVNEDKVFDDHYYNNYNYFLVSDEQFSDHTPNGTVNKCNDSLREKAYEIGMPWAKDNYARNQEELKAAVKKAVDANSKEIILIWNIDWVDHVDMRDEISKVMFELNIEPTYRFGSCYYSEYRGVRYVRARYQINLENGKYETLNKSTTLDELKKQILATNDQNKAIYMDAGLANEKNFKSLITWAYDEKDIYLDISSKGKVSDSVAYIKVWKTDKSEKVDKATKAYSMSEIEKLVKEFAKDYSGDVKYITYYYENEFSGKEWDEVEEYIYEKSKEWNEKYCVNYIGIEAHSAINRVTFSLTEGYHKNGPYVEVRKASCTKTSLWQQKCTKCNYVVDEIEYETNGVHDAYWDYLSDTSRRIKCHECDYVGATETKIGDIWGYYDEQKTKELFDLINERRLSAMHYNIDDWGNLISMETPPQFVYDEDLAVKAREYIIDTINRNFGTSNEYVFERLWIKGYDAPSLVCSLLIDTTSGRNIMNEKTYDILGVACFSYDKDGTGIKNETIWCIYFGKTTN